MMAGPGMYGSRAGNVSEAGLEPEPRIVIESRGYIGRGWGGSLSEITIEDNNFR